ncbi:peptide chain release factor 1-like [Calliopsis andreniformis]|uniref:peptide chain release factor 1-like n=1 Tax=Calliopsis andreniformis TaxID=337506 RepID=UPI003FCE8E8F
MTQGMQYWKSGQVQEEKEEHYLQKKELEVRAISNTGLGGHKEAFEHTEYSECQKLNPQEGYILLPLLLRYYLRSSGPGGQSVNTTDSAVRVTHLPTGIIVIHLYEIERQEKGMERSTLRKSQIGSGDRSESIRIYYFPHSRITDHRINLTSHRLEQIIKECELGEFIEALISGNEAERLAGES